MAAHATLATEQLIFQTNNALVDTFASLQGSEGGVIAASQVHELLTKIHDNLENAVSKWVANPTYILVYHL